MAEDDLEIGYVAGVHGVRGALKFQLHDPDSAALRVGRRLMVRRENGAESWVEVSSASEVPGHPGRHRVMLVGVASRDRADSLRGATLWIPRADLPPLNEGEFYLADAIGLPVQRMRGDGVQALGEVTGLTSNGVQDLFEVTHRAEDGSSCAWLLPVLPHCIVAIEDERILVDLPEGMLPDALEREA